MANQLCIGEIERALGRKPSDEELDALSREIKRRRLAREAEGMGYEQATRQAAKDFGDDMERAALLAKRDAALQARARLELTDFIRTRFANRPDLGLEARLVGINSDKFSSRSSAAAEQESLAGYYAGGLTADLEKAGVMEMLSSGALDREAARALWDGGGKGPAGEIGKAVSKWQEIARLDANKAGAYIRKLAGWIVRQSHDVFKIRSAGFDRWRSVILPRLDLDRTFGGLSGEQIQDALRRVWDGLSTGIHLKAGTDAPVGFTGPGSLAKRLSHERELHFKSADDWFDYNNEFGTGNLREAIIRGLENSARATGLMRKFGPNPSATYKSVVDDIRKDLTGDTLVSFERATKEGGKLWGRLRTVDGTTRIPVNEMGAQIASSARVIQNFKLGSALLSSVVDLPVRASELRYQGHGGYLQNVAEGVADLFRGKGTQARRELEGGLGVFADAMRSGFVSRFSLAEDGVPGGLSKVQRWFFKWNGLTWWTDTLRAGAMRSMAWRAAHHRAKTFDQLDGEYQRVLGTFGIGAKEWDTIRASATKEADGRLYLTPENVADRRVADLYRAYLVDRGNVAVIEPGARTRAIMTRGSRPGSLEGELLRFIGQFKSFGVAFTEKVIGRELYGRGAEGNVLQALANGKGEFIGLAQLMLWSTVFGYIAMSLKDLSKGRTPRDPTDWGKTWTAAFLQGGGAGIYGDFLFGEMRNRFGQTFISTLAGPTAGSIDDFADLVGRWRAGDDGAAQAINFAMAHMPFNFFYTRAALDYLVLYRTAEALNPGFLRRMERRIEKQNAQTFLVRPSQVIN